MANIQVYSVTILIGAELIIYLEIKLFPCCNSECNLLNFQQNLIWTN